MTDPDGDRFSFAVSAPSPLSADNAGRPAWRFTVQADLAGKVFAKLRLDVVARDAELAAVEWIRLPGMLEFAQAPTREAVAVARRQHFAEKLHALTRDYGGRPNTRTKDLVAPRSAAPDRPGGEVLERIIGELASRRTLPIR